MNPRRTSLAGLALGLLGFAAGLTQPGCEAAPCTPTSPTPNEPSPAIECPSGELCYQGACIAACNAGQERATRCSSDDDCGAARPRCVDAYCSACEQGEVCIPTLNICQAVQEVLLPDPPNPPTGGDIPPSPLDGGLPTGGLTRDVDAGVGPAPEVEVTHVGFVDLAEVTDYRGMGPSPTYASTTSVDAYSVRGNGTGLRWRADLTPPAIQCDDEADSGAETDDGCGERVPFDFEQCTIRPLRTVTTTITGEALPPSPVSLGTITIDSHPDFPGSLRPELQGAIVARFDEGPPRQYALMPLPNPGELLVFSALPFDQHYLSVGSNGAAGITAGAWPNSPGSVFLGHHVPFRLEPTPGTLQQIQAGVSVASPATQDVAFQWSRIDTGNDSFERVVVRAMGTDHELFCSAVEGQNGEDTIVIPAITLNEWRRREPTMAEFPLFFERASAQRLPVNSSGEGLVVDVTVRVRHTLATSLRFP